MMGSVIRTACGNSRVADGPPRDLREGGRLLLPKLTDGRDSNCRRRSRVWTPALHRTAPQAAALAVRQKTSACSGIPWCRVAAEEQLSTAVRVGPGDRAWRLHLRELGNATC